MAVLTTVLVPQDDSKYVLIVTRFITPALDIIVNIADVYIVADLFQGDLSVTAESDNSHNSTIITTMLHRFNI